MKTAILIFTVAFLTSTVNGDCWWTGCQPDSWAVTGCAQYNMQTVEQTPCPGGKKYHCCSGGAPNPNPNPNPPPNGVQISQNEFRSAVTSNGYPSPSTSQYNSFMSQMSRGQINTKQEAAMALAQFLHESGGLVYKKEIACAQSNCPNDYRTPGCDAPGQYYYGRGYIQLSWCEWNYKPASMDLYGDLRLVTNPDQVANNEDVNWATAFWFWGKNVHNNGGASGKFGATTNAINGNLECRGGPNDKANRRFQIYGKVRQAFGLPGAGDASGCWR